MFQQVPTRQVTNVKGLTSKENTVEIAKQGLSWYYMEDLGRKPNFAQYGYVRLCLKLDYLYNPLLVYHHFPSCSLFNKHLEGITQVQRIGFREILQESLIILMGKSMVSG